MKQEHIITIDQTACIRCGLCVKDCVVNNIELTESGARLFSQDCIKCGHCAAICPTNAVALSGFADPPEEIASGIRLDADTLLGALKTRRSIRHFTDRDVSPEIIARIIEAGRYTPTASNKQGVSYVVLRENKDEYERIAVGFFRRAVRVGSAFTKKLCRVTIDEQFLFKGAPVAIVIKANQVVDGGLAASNMELMAQAHGLGVLYSGFFTIAGKFSRKLKKKLPIQKGEKLVTTLVIGYPDVKYQRTAQKERPAVRYD